MIPMDIVLITTDHMRHDAFGLQNPLIRTPHLDALARSGTIFERAYCVSPVCPPARASLITGKYPLSHGLREIGMPLAEENQTLADLLREKGYHCVLTGKSHLRPQTAPDGAAAPPEEKLRLRSCDHTYYGFREIHITEDIPDGAYTDYLKAHQLTPEEADLTEDFSQTHWITRQAIQAIQQTQDPLFLWVSFPAPHPPCKPPRKYLAQYAHTTPAPAIPAPGPEDPFEFLKKYGSEPFPGGGRRGAQNPTDFSEFAIPYYAQISFLDHEIGSILAALENRGKKDETLIVFTSDHGEYLGDHGLILKGPWLYESLIRVPLLISGPGLPSGATSDAITESVDLLPTLAELAGVSLPADIQGLSLIPVIKDKKSHRQSALTSYDVYDLGLSLKSLVTDEYKLVFSAADSVGILFDLKNDPLEQRNLFQDPAYSTVRQKMTELLCSRLCSGENFFPVKSAVW